MLAIPLRDGSDKSSADDKSDWRSDADSHSSLARCVVFAKLEQLHFIRWASDHAARFAKRMRIPEIVCVHAVSFLPGLLAGCGSDYPPRNERRNQEMRYESRQFVSELHKAHDRSQSQRRREKLEHFD